MSDRQRTENRIGTTPFISGDFSSREQDHFLRNARPSWHGRALRGKGATKGEGVRQGSANWPSDGHHASEPWQQEEWNSPVRKKKVTIVLIGDAFPRAKRAKWANRAVVIS